MTAVEPPPERALNAELASYHQKAYSDFTERRQAFDPTDGLSRAEADLVAREYFAETFGLCGAVDQVIDDGAQWLAWARVGVAGAPVSEPIRVNKRTGTVSHPDGIERTSYQVLQAAEERYRANLRRFAPDAPAAQAPP